MRPLLLLLALAVLSATGCATAAAPAEPGIGPRTAVAPEHRSTCEALGRVDLAVVGTDPAAQAAATAGLDAAAARAPADIRPTIEGLAAAYRAPGPPVRDDPRRSMVVAWVNQRCGGMR